jgi:hypothetical protein
MTPRHGRVVRSATLAIEQMWRRRVAGAKVMLAEEDAIEPRALGAGPQIEVRVEVPL